MFFKLYLLATPIFFAIDMVWLVLIARKFYSQQMGDLLTKNINWPAAILFYLIFIAGIILFAVMPAIKEQSLFKAFTYGAFFGLCAYATYDLTNLATTRDWPLTLTIVDIAWGTVLSASVSTLTFIISRQLGFWNA